MYVHERLGWRGRQQRAATRDRIRVAFDTVSHKLMDWQEMVRSAGRLRKIGAQNKNHKQQQSTQRPCRANGHVPYISEHAITWRSLRDLLVSTQLAPSCSLLPALLTLMLMSPSPSEVAMAATFPTLEVCRGDLIAPCPAAAAPETRRRRVPSELATCVRRHRRRHRRC